MSKLPIPNLISYLVILILNKLDLILVVWIYYTDLISYFYNLSCSTILMSQHNNYQPMRFILGRPGSKICPSTNTIYFHIQLCWFHNTDINLFLYLCYNKSDSILYLRSFILVTPDLKYIQVLILKLIINLRGLFLFVPNLIIPIIIQNHILVVLSQ